MAEQTTPETGVQQEPADVQDRMERFLQQFAQDQAGGTIEQPPAGPTPTRAAPQTAEAPAEAPEGQAATDELTPEDIPGETAGAQPAGDAFEIVHNGKQHKLTREDTIKYAQQGFDYTQKTQAVAEQMRQAQALLQSAKQVEALTPLVAQDFAQVQALGAQLQKYQSVDWVQIATDNPLEYPKYRAQFDTLKAAYDKSVQDFQAKSGALKQKQQQIVQQQAAQELPKLLERIPEWKDPEKFQSGAAELRGYLMKQGFTADQVDNANEALPLSIAYKAMQYDRLVAAKQAKVKELRTAPPVTKPGAVQGEAAAQDASRKLGDRLRRTGDLQDAAAVLMNRWK